jgi:phage-related protein
MLYIRTQMNWSITYYNERVRREVMAMPAGIVADYVRLTDAMAVHGADLRMPHSKAMGSGLFELRPKWPERIGRVFCCTLARKRLKDVQHG